VRRNLVHLTLSPSTESAHRVSSRFMPRSTRLQALPLGVSDAVQVGERVAAIGSSFGQVSSLTVGVVSAVGRQSPH